MSTKTTIKRIALVSVAALGFGLLSVVPSNAAAQLDSVTVSAATATQETTDTLTATSALVTATLAGTAGVDTLTVTASIVSGPAYVQPILSFKESTTAEVAGTGTSAVSVAPKSTSSVTQATGKFNVYLNAPTVVGTYVVKLTPTGGVNAVAATVSITVTAKAAISTVATSATSILNVGETSSATADAVVTAGKSASLSTAAATIKVALKNASAAAVTAESFTATVSGPGLLGSGEDTGTTITGPSAVGRALTVHNGHVLQVFPDGTSGISTITISSAAGVVLATETVTFFGDVATIATTVKKAVIGGTSAVAGVLDIVVKDASGVAVSNLTTINLVSSDTTKIAGAYTGVTPVWTASTQSYLVPVTPVAAGTASITVTTKSSATATGVDAAAASVRVGSSTPASIIVAPDKLSYAPGEAFTITVTLLDAAGLGVADGRYDNVFSSTGITAAPFTISGIDSSTVTVVGTSAAAGIGTRTGIIPLTEGDVTFKWTTGTNLATANQAIAGSVVVSVSSPGTSAATDAANEATDAANAATDAALAAAEAADAATTAAQEASDAVAALSESVTKLIAGLQAQIKSLAAVVAKIAKKVKA
jgi:hypothetical protein